MSRLTMMYILIKLCRKEGIEHRQLMEDYIKEASLENIDFF
jgi:hypothetical protein